MMTKVSIFGLLAATLLLAASCKGGGTFKYDSQGAAYEVVVVADHDVWNSPVGDTLRAMFYEQFPMVNREETSFDVLRVLPEGFNNLVTRHRNILMVDVDPTAAAPALTVGQDAYAAPQIVLNVTAPDVAGLLEVVNTNRDDIMLALETAEKNRDVADARSHTPTRIASLIEDKFGFKMSTGPGYTVRSESEDFLWLSYEMPTSSQGIVIYTYPFSGLKDFEQESLIARRDEFVKRIPAENPGSHMATNPEIVQLLYKRIDGRQWAELSGFWDAVGDFMGGPYRNYSTLDAANQRMIAIDFYVYAPDPRLMQRNYIRQLEHFIYTVEIPGQSPSWTEVGAGEQE